MSVELPPVQFTGSGRPLLVSGESECHLLTQVTVKLGGVVIRQGGYASLTTHRLLWLDPETLPGLSCCVPLDWVQQISFKQTLSSQLWKPYKIKVHILGAKTRRPTQGLVELQLLSKDPSTPQLVKQAQVALLGRAWEQHAQFSVSSNANNSSFGKVPSASLPSASSLAGATDLSGDYVFINAAPAASSVHAPSSSGRQGTPVNAGSAGVSGILKREERIAAATDRTLDEAFQDLEALAGKAQELVHLAERFRGTLGSPDTHNVGSTDEKLDAEVQAELVNLGLASPVTKEASGALYHQQLARQLADFVVPRLKKDGGLVLLSDVYCLFNRARGVELVSPDDLAAAAGLLSSLRLSLQLRTFPSGVKVITSESHSVEWICRVVADFVQSEGLGPPLTSTSLAASLSIPVTIASEYLLTAEEQGILCRDDNREGLKYFRNFFSECVYV